MPASVSIGIVTWNAEPVLERCLAGVRAQTHPALDLLVVDNASADRTREILARHTAAHERLYLERNVGFSAAHNLAVERTRGDFYLSLNPDVFLSPTFVGTLADAMGQAPQAGAATGKLRRAADPARIDSTGIYLVPAQRHLDRGSGELDRGQYDRRELVFGASGAAALFRRSMLEDVAIDGEVFDEDFFSYREDADLAWRAQWLGWGCLYVPTAIALHGRLVTPDRRRALPAALNRMSVRNRFLLRIKNQPVRQFLRFAAPALWRDAQVAGYVLLREHRSLPAFGEVVRLLPRMLRKRRHIMARRRVPVADLTAWFRERSRPLECGRPGAQAAEKGRPERRRDRRAKT